MGLWEFSGHLCVYHATLLPVICHLSWVEVSFHSWCVLPLSNSLHSPFLWLYSCQLLPRSCSAAGRFLFRDPLPLSPHWLLYQNRICLSLPEGSFSIVNGWVGHSHGMWCMWFLSMLILSLPLLCYILLSSLDILQLR